MKRIGFQFCLAALVWVAAFNCFVFSSAAWTQDFGLNQVFKAGDKALYHLDGEEHLIEVAKIRRDTFIYIKNAITGKPFEDSASKLHLRLIDEDTFASVKKHKGYRVWADPDDKNRFIAKFVDQTPFVVHLIKLDGTKSEIRKTKLHVFDATYLRFQRRKSDAMKAKIANENKEAETLAAIKAGEPTAIHALRLKEVRANLTNFPTPKSKALDASQKYAWNVRPDSAVGTLSERIPFAIEFEEGYSVFDHVFSPNGQLAAVATKGPTGYPALIYIVDTKLSTVAHKSTHHQEEFRLVGLQNDGQVLITHEKYTQNRRLDFWRLGTSDESDHIEGWKCDFLDVILMDDQRLLANSARTISLLDWKTKKTLFSFSGTGNLAVSQTHKLLAICVNDKILILSLDNGRVLGALDGMASRMQMADYMAFSPNGQYFACHYSFGKTLIWNLANGRLEIEIMTELKPGTGHMHGLVWTSNDYLLLQDSVLISRELGVPVWSYKPATKINSFRQDTSKRLWYTSQHRHVPNRITAIPVSLPLLSCHDYLQKLDPKAFEVLHKGVAVRLDLQLKLPADVVSSIRKSIEKKLKTIGFVVDANSQVVIECKYRRGYPNYYDFGANDVEQWRKNGPQLSSSHHFLARIHSADQTYWERTSSGVKRISNGLDSRAKNDKALQEMGIKFFQQVKIPDKIPMLPKGKKFFFGQGYFGEAGVE